MVVTLSKVNLHPGSKVKPSACFDQSRMGAIIAPWRLMMRVDGV